MDRCMPQLNEQLCNRCGLCVQACPCGSVELDEKGLTFSCPETCPDAKRACDCGLLCEEVCPTGAINVAFEIVLGEDEGSGTAKGEVHGKNL